MRVFTARQPIVNAKQRVVAYELLFRDSKENKFPAHVPPNTATAKLLISNYLNAGFDTITEGKPALVIPIPLINVIGITIAILVQLVTKPLLSSITSA